MAVDASAVEAQSPGSEVITSITQPAAKTGQAAYGKVASGVQWYIEQWEDLVHEARAERTPSEEGLTADSLVAGLTDARVAWDIPGHLRLRPTPLKGHSRLAEETAQALGSIPGVQQVDISSLTGSVLIAYDTETFPSREALLSAFKPSPETPAETQG
ncbi:MAG: hypothetical protein KIS91_09660 [Anaerolineae bacterium]|nr:hypothetical protein [Anaerolineae bacterium]